MSLTEPDAREILGWLGEAGVSVWVDGGWGVDALIGQQTREHKDLDLIVLATDVDPVQATLARRGFAFASGVPANFVLRDRRGREVDVHPVRFDADGDGLLETGDGEPFRHGASAFTGIGAIGGLPARCLSADAQMLNHSWGYVPKGTDFHDMSLLSERLGTRPSGPYA
jgi:lincosamide nucleotidyltransferase A/C/D/E